MDEFPIPSVRKRIFVQPESLIRSPSTNTKPIKYQTSKSKRGAPPDLRIPYYVQYHAYLWLFIGLQNIILDFGRPFAAILFPKDLFPLNRPSVGDYMHMLHNITMAFCIVYMLKDKVPVWFSNLLAFIYTMGASIHLVGDSVNHRLYVLGYKNYLPLEDNVIMQNLEPKSLIQAFQLLYIYDEYIGHVLWYSPLYVSLYLYFSNSFHHTPQPTRISFLFIVNFIFNTTFFWYLSTEGQITELSIVLLLALTVTSVLQWYKGQYLDINGKFLYLCFIVGSLLILCWSYYHLDNTELRKRYPGVLYVPEPWSVISLHYQHDEFIDLIRSYFI